MQASPPSTIVALSSGAGKAGVAVLRLSGPMVRFAIETIAGSLPPPRQAVLRTLVGVGDAIDRGLVLFFPAPHSFTGEDVAEFHVHGSRAILARLIAELLALPGLRLAEPGEFTRRAFDAGKLDLAEVEGLADLIDSETEWQRRQSFAQMQGALSDQVLRWRPALIEAMAMLEAELDFSDEADVPAGLLAQVRGRLETVRQELEQALAGFARGERLREGFTVVLLGPPNAGKSSLLNALARRDVAIVSPVAGTTRDAIEVRLDLEGLPVTLVDTAGLRESDDPIEQEGVRRSLSRAASADLVVRLRAIDSAPDQFTVADELRVATKCDLGGRSEPDELAVSALTGGGLESLLATIASRLATAGAGEPALLTRERHRAAVSDALAALARCLDGPRQEAELHAEDLRLTLRALARLIGEVDVEQVLDALFSGFCIGK